MKMMKKMFTLIVTGLLAGEAWAGLRVGPSVIERVVPPGSMAVGTYQVTNTGESPIQVRVEFEDWMAVLFGKRSEIPVEEWLQLEPSQFELKPGETKEIQYRVRTPGGLRGEKVAQVFFSVETAKGVRSKLGLIFFLTAQGTEKLEADIEKATFEVVPAEGGGDELNASIRFRNSSNVHIRPQGALVILRGKEKQQEILIREVPGVYPDTRYDFSYRYPLEKLRPGEYTVRLRLDYGHTYGRIDRFLQKDFPLVWKSEKEDVKESAPLEKESKELV